MQQKLELLGKSKDNFISLKQAKQYLRVDHSHDDQMIDELIQIALEAAENYIGQSLALATWKITVYSNCPQIIKLLRRPVAKIIQFKLFKNNGEINYLTEDHYLLDNFIGKIQINRTYPVQKVEISYQTGYEILPLPIKHGMLEHIAKLYDLRGTDQALPLSAKSLYQSYKQVRL